MAETNMAERDLPFTGSLPQIFVMTRTGTAQSQEARNSIQGIHMDSRDPSMLPPKVHLNRKLEPHTESGPDPRL